MQKLHNMVRLGNQNVTIEQKEMVRSEAKKKGLRIAQYMREILQEKLESLNKEAG